MEAADRAAGARKETPLKTKKAILALALVLAALALAACGAKTPLEGRWKLDSATGTTATLLSLINADTVVVEFDRDGRMLTYYDGKTLSNESGDEVPVTTYKTNGNTIGMTTAVGGSSAEIRGTWIIEGDRLTMTSEGETATYTRFR